MIRNQTRNRVIGLTCAAILLTSGCVKKDIPVVALEDMTYSWTVEKITDDLETVKLSNADAVIDACTGERTTELGGDFTVYNPFLAHGSYNMPEGGYHHIKVVSYVKGKEFYVLCQDETTYNLVAETIDEIPEFVDLASGKKMTNHPSLDTVSDSVRETFFELKDQYDSTGQSILILEDSLIQLTPSLYGSIGFSLGEQGMEIQLIDFTPFSTDIDHIGLALGYDEETEQAYLLLSYGDRYFNSAPLEIFSRADLMQTIPYIYLSAKPVFTKDVLEPHVQTPVYEISYEQDGQPVTEEIRLTYRPGVFEEGQADRPAEQVPTYKDEGPLLYLHTKPFDDESPIRDSEMMRAAGTDVNALLEAISHAKPVSRAGDEQEYRYLTIFEGMKSQEFEVSYKQRSKKLDIYLTDAKREQTFKLTSEGAETFLSYFPEVRP
ncbi:hypothetical protein [Exiguobacterium algae]|uniref:hypothetical protein n=1 Tax=Exiguobacterium algae TaxID=2751250 RepID=UPI001BECE9A7|nr:hypothetical protein [Exiguobacterium algae]